MLEFDGRADRRWRNSELVSEWDEASKAFFLWITSFLSAHMRNPNSLFLQKIERHLLMFFRYTESIDILYSDNVLYFRQTRTIVDLKATIPTERLHSIRSLQLDCPLDTEWLNDTDGLWAYPHTWPTDISYVWE